MQMAWAHKIDVITHLFNVVILLVTVVFQASVSAQLWAYAASVLALLFGASLAATLDVRQRWHGVAPLAARCCPFGLITLLFAVMGVLIVVQQPRPGVAHRRWSFVAVVLVDGVRCRAGCAARSCASTASSSPTTPTRQRWEEICKLEFQVLVPHDPTHGALADKEDADPQAPPPRPGRADHLHRGARWATRATSCRSRACRSSGSTAPR